MYLGIRSVEQVRQVLDAAKYPPQGRRGVGVGTACLYGAALNDYIERANNEILVIVMVETREAVDHIDGILSLDGVDGVFIGPYDLSASYGMTGKTGDPVIQNAIRQVCAACKRHGKAAGMHLLSRDEIRLKEALAQGFTFLALSYDADYLYSGSKQMVEMARFITAGR